MTVSLTGFMGSGKSSVGKRLSALLCCSFIDLDSYIVEICGESICDMFRFRGEAYFREKEAEALTRVLGNRSQSGSKDLVLSLGGGTMTSAQCASMIHEETVCVYLRTSPETLSRNLSHCPPKERPLLSNAAAKSLNELEREISLILQDREADYMRYSHIVTDTDGKSIYEIADEIADLVRKSKSVI